MMSTEETFYRFHAGPHLHEVCDACNYNNHRCHFCGDDLTHAEARSTNGHLHPCYADDGDWYSPTFEDDAIAVIDRSHRSRFPNRSQGDAQVISSSIDACIVMIALTGTDWGYLGAGALFLAIAVLSIWLDGRE